jgi:tetratricopeptide (TPR) repeat protein
VTSRLVLFWLSPGPPAQVTVLPPKTGSFVDFERLTRLQRLLAETRGLLRSRFPSLPHGARVGLLHPPIMSTYAFGGDKALQVWYRDTTLRWLRYDDFRGHADWELSAIVEFEQAGHPQMVLVSPASMRHYLVAGSLTQGEAWQEAFDHLALADSLQAERGARAYLGRLAGRRALCWFGLERLAEAEREARRGLALWPDGSDARYVLAAVMAFTGRRSEAKAQLDTLLRLYPGERSAHTLRDSLRIWAGPGP